MLARDVKLFGRYVAKVSGRHVIVQITDESAYGGWTARSETTGREVRIKSARRLSAMDGGSLDGSQVRTMTDSRVSAGQEGQP
jgi:hypothetical protein